MNIVFYCGHKYYGGLNLNGGSRTILLSSKTLSDMGHKVDVVTKSDRFTWFEHKKVISKIPEDTDAVIACSISDIDGMYEKAPKKAKLFYWMRGWENWQMPEDKIWPRLIVGRHKNIVNSSWLKRKLENHNIPCYLVWQGVDIDFWLEKTVADKEQKPVRIGCLYNTHHKTKRWDMFVDLMNKLGKDALYYGFGTERPKQELYSFLKNPQPYALRSFYESLNIWFTPTEKEGFPNTPLEAALCGCLVVYRNIESNGMEDIATDETAMRFNNMDEAVEIIKNPDYSRVKKMQDLIVNKIGDRKQNMIKLIEILQK